MVAVVVSVNAPVLSDFALNSLVLMRISTFTLLTALPFASLIVPVMVTSSPDTVSLIGSYVMVMSCFSTLNVVLASYPL